MRTADDLRAAGARAAQSPVEPPPIEHLHREAGRRRRTRSLLIGSSAAGAAIVLAGALAVLTFGGDDPQQVVAAGTGDGEPLQSQLVDDDEADDDGEGADDGDASDHDDGDPADGSRVAEVDDDHGDDDDHGYDDDRYDDADDRDGDGGAADDGRSIQVWPGSLFEIEGDGFAVTVRSVGGDEAAALAGELAAEADETRTVDGHTVWITTDDGRTTWSVIDGDHLVQVSTEHDDDDDEDDDAEIPVDLEALLRSILANPGAAVYSPGLLDLSDLEEYLDGLGHDLGPLFGSRRLDELPDHRFDLDDLEGLEGLEGLDGLEALDGLEGLQIERLEDGGFKLELDLGDGELSIEQWFGPWVLGDGDDHGSDGDG